MPQALGLVTLDDISRDLYLQIEHTNNLKAVATSHTHHRRNTSTPKTSTQQPTMPRQVAPPPSGEFSIVLQKPFSGTKMYPRIRIQFANGVAGTPNHTIEVIGEPNRSASVRMSQYAGESKSSEKSGDVPKYVLAKQSFVALEVDKVARDDVNELMELISSLRGFPSHSSKDVYGSDVKLDFSTMEIQWSNQDDDPTANEVTQIEDEQKDDFKRVADSIEALARTFAKQDSAI